MYLKVQYVRIGHLLNSYTQWEAAHRQRNHQVLQIVAAVS